MAIYTLAGAVAVAAAVVAFQSAGRGGVALAPPPFACPAAPRPLGYATPRLVFVGDVHGADLGLREVLAGAGVIDRDHALSGGRGGGCARKASSSSAASHQETVVVQVGDVVDRGANASQAWDCLDQLQDTSPPGTVVRLVGNHEVSWLQGKFKGSNDPPAVRWALTLRIRDAVVQGRAVGAASFLGGQLLATHAGVRPAMVEVLAGLGTRAAAAETTPGGDRGGSGGGSREGSSDAEAVPPKVNNGLGAAAPQPVMSATAMADAVTHALRTAVEGCAANPRPQPSAGRSPPLSCPALDRGEVFAAGPERGGRSMGGPFWTDFSVVAAIAPGSAPALEAVTQVVGHSAADCDVADASACQPIRASPFALAVDGAMYWGNRAFLEVTAGSAGGPAPTFVSHTRQRDGTWLKRSLAKGPQCGRELA